MYSASTFCWHGPFPGSARMPTSIAALNFTLSFSHDDDSDVKGVGVSFGDSFCRRV